jgi:class 3 adenylate cyclase
VADHGTERKLVTVLFIDVKNSTGLSRELELEDWWAVSACLFTLMCEAVDRFDGWVENFSGDGAAAVFEADAMPDQHAHRACSAALWLRDAIRAAAVEVRGAYGVELLVRIGINSGEVLTGTIGDNERRFHTANGYAVALAKRMEGLAQPYRIYLTEYTASLVTRVFQLRDLGALPVKGVDAPVGVFELERQRCDHPDRSCRRLIATDRIPAIDPKEDQHAVSVSSSQAGVRAEPDGRGRRRDAGGGEIPPRSAEHPRPNDSERADTLALQRRLLQQPPGCHDPAEYDLGSASRAQPATVDQRDRREPHGSDRDRPARRQVRLG